MPTRRLAPADATYESCTRLQLAMEQVQLRQCLTVSPTLRGPHCLSRAILGPRPLAVRSQCPRSPARWESESPKLTAPHIRSRCRSSRGESLRFSARSSSCAGLAIRTMSSGSYSVSFRSPAAGHYAAHDIAPARSSTSRDCCRVSRATISVSPSVPHPPSGLPAAPRGVAGSCYLGRTEREKRVPAPRASERRLRERRDDTRRGGARRARDRAEYETDAHVCTGSECGMATRRDALGEAKRGWCGSSESSAGHGRGRWRGGRERGG